MTLPAARREGGPPCPPLVAPISELAVPGPVPRAELRPWRERFGVVAGITTRGDGPEPFDLGLWTDRPVAEAMNRWRAFRRAEPGFAATVMAHQVHAADVRWHEGASGWVIHEGADGHATARAGLLLCVTVADCVPVYLVAPAQRAVALLHAGWRGTAAGILSRGVALLAERTGARPDELVMHCGPAICGGCYEVGAEVMTGVGLPAEGPGPWHVDLRERLAAQAAALGMGETSVSTWCTAHHRERFHSHRASGGRDGRMVAYLGFPAAR